MLKPEAGLFERARNSPSARVLPRPDAPLDKLKQLGRVLCKAVLDEHPIGAGVGRFLFEFLVLEQTGERRVFDERRPRVALVQPELPRHGAAVCGEDPAGARRGRGGRARRE